MFSGWLHGAMLIASLITITSRSLLRNRHGCAIPSQTSMARGWTGINGRGNGMSGEVEWLSEEMMVRKV